MVALKLKLVMPVTLAETDSTSNVATLLPTLSTVLS
jgi:hypothetical protein